MTSEETPETSHSERCPAWAPAVLVPEIRSTLMFRMNHFSLLNLTGRSEEIFLNGFKQPPPPPLVGAHATALHTPGDQAPEVVGFTHVSEAILQPGGRESPETWGGIPEASQLARR
jgi:hypothetical protein